MTLSGARIGVLALCAAGPLLLGASATSRILALSPENREAQAIGPLNGYLEGQGGSGDIWLKMRDGEILRGRFEVKVGGTVGAYGKSRGIDRPGGAYTISGRRGIVGGDPGFVDMKGPSGVTLHCEVINDTPNAHGSGVCLFSNGAEYRVVY
ncbi:MAG: hypothetical protein ACREE0_17050 [Phenylobacterium sp.]